MTPAKKRFVTLDVFRGMTVFLMIVVNTQGSGAEPYPAMMHAEWNGCTLTDLVFPSFLFAVGNAMAFTQPGLMKIFRRSLLLFVIGWLLTIVSDRAGTGSDLVVLDAADLAPVASVRLPRRVPAGFHGTWLPDAGAR